ncbi:MAG TPA: M56 family metallopeptidase [Bacteroidales bacterium]|nr:M56 family metallopeptidase [Bacteroidales bacterium]
MNDVLMYVINVSAGLALFVIPYMFFLRNDSNLVLKRIYLLTALALSWLIPVIPVNFGMNVPQGTMQFFIDPGYPSGIVASSSVDGNATASISLKEIVLFVYIAGIILLLIRNAALFIRLTKGRGVSRESGDISYSGNDQAFAFFRRIYLPENLKETKNIESILIHERAHIRQKHYIDLIVMELTLLFTWFSPFTWLISGMIKENHEHLADREVLSRGVNPAHYRAQLLNQALGVTVFRLGQAFNHSLTKKRFEMMKKLKFSRSGLVKLIILVPAILVTFSFIVNNNISNGTINGKVVFAQTGEPAPGASVVIKGTTIGTVADRQGEFKLSADKKVTLVVSFVGFASQQVKASPGEYVNVALEKNEYEIDINEPAPPAKAEKPARVSPPAKAVKPAKVSADEKVEDTNTVFFIVEDMPSFPGGKKALHDYVYSHLEFPEAARREGIDEGQVVVDFVVNTDGSLSDIDVEDSSNKVFNEAALNVFRDMPKWNPGKQRGKSVRVNVRVPVRFNSNMK